MTYFSKFPCAQLRSQDGRTVLSICSYGYAYPNANDPYDRDWHKNYLLLMLPGFKAEIDEIILEGHSLRNWINELRAFSALKTEKIFFEPTDPYFSLTFRFLSRRKNVCAEGYVQYPIADGAVLRFELETDLTFIDSFIAGLETILHVFPEQS
ncbi:hypothetical protein NIE88_01020 [Sporolactobacillus shoreicorticis]|uniref:Uncharacterized protein n=1 Tax=Sporolactobacillus shoreicorticis TaxID=1923877 RepID=A0ABW5S4C6_9BACL|nr:hypothetical protein [Sporolactobacillus shoreicorticis]MCO7124363.1 hypothetical protein [Sporolactobacillus shoreicorticis]